MKPTDPFLVVDKNAFSILDLVDENNEYHKDVDISQATKKAKELGLDLVCFIQAKDDSNALCKILDYGKWKYNIEKKNKKQTHKNEIKEIRFSPEIGDHDIDHKIKRAKEFVENGYELSFTMKLRRRIHKDLAREKMESIVEKCSVFANVTNQKEEPNCISVKLNKK